MNKYCRRSLKIYDKKGLNDRRQLENLKNARLYLKALQSKDEARLTYKRKGGK